MLLIPADSVSPTEAARLLGLSKRQVLRLVESGALTAVRTPLGRLISRESVDALAKERVEQRARR